LDQFVAYRTAPSNVVSLPICLYLNDTTYRAKVFEQVNRKCPLWNKHDFTTVSLLQQSYPLKLTTPKISTSRIAKLSTLTIAIQTTVCCCCWTSEQYDRLSQEQLGFLFHYICRVYNFS